MCIKQENISTLGMFSVGQYSLPRPFLFKKFVVFSFFSSSLDFCSFTAEPWIYTPESTCVSRLQKISEKPPVFYKPVRLTHCNAAHAVRQPFFFFFTDVGNVDSTQTCISVFFKNKFKISFGSWFFCVCAAALFFSTNIYPEASRLFKCSRNSPMPTNSESAEQIPHKCPRWCVQ